VALDQSALIEVLEALMAAEVDDRIRQAAQTLCRVKGAVLEESVDLAGDVSLQAPADFVAGNALGSTGRSAGRGPGRD
jgi:hypothetical protein